MPSGRVSLTVRDQCRTGVALGWLNAHHGGFCCKAPACGGSAGNTCTASEYCAYEPPAACGAADSESTCRQRPCQPCPELHEPVCGCDGKSYDNACRANAAGTGISAVGACAN
ncbi:MAG TPA: Kazal-type serine protease inhibitor domain-containing protein [Polyangiaceae bacterium]|nr:Kazal-type serine protease inhibitor domain-containing protein [Polyangiaceae bacterium]